MQALNEQIEALMDWPLGHVSNVKVIENIVYFLGGKTKWTAKLTKGGNIKKNSVRLDIF